jgi:hypothetical protein
VVEDVAADDDFGVLQANCPNTRNAMRSYLNFDYVQVNGVDITPAPITLREST